ncbi:ArgP/LysG family DNA-binding transcriptional regulator [Demequina sp. NBRC 110056]|uniref:ArgP/LysG family DNA-binding transcriptional regulator n=1 Tax=Demequina sp. NBRC 110056 TaxID=1570345 RepID=UPI0009FE5914|nr:ArgP/LysG family DNA-binding transcriptional regulator [Demequina sp. NBRC 110056]
MRIPAELAHTLTAVVEEGSLDAAARRLHVTQSAVSQRIATLERIAGQAVLVRSRPVRPTPAGEAVLQFSRQVAHLEADLNGALRRDEAGRATVRLAANADSMSAWLMPALAVLATVHGIMVEVQREDESRTADLLSRGDVSAAVTTRATAVSGCSSTPLGTMTYEAVATPAFVERWLPEGPTPAALAVAPVVDFDRSDDIQSRWLHAVAPEAQPPRHRIPSSSEFNEAIALGMGWGLMPPAQRSELDRDLVALGGPTIAVALHWQQWRVRSALLDTVATEVRAAAGAVLAAPHPQVG